MIKKFFSLILVVLICCSTVITVFAQAEHSHVAQNDASNCNEEPAVTDVTPHSSEIVTEEPEIVINPDYVYTVKMDPDYEEWFFGAPDEILSASTSELLEYFMKSPFMISRVLSLASTSRPIIEHDFSCHEAFRELISREDCVEALETYAGSILYSSETDELDRAIFEKLLEQPLVKSVISDFLSAAANCPNLRSIYNAAEVAPSSVGDYVGTVNGIKYYSAGTISTANGRSVEVCTPERELTQSQVAYYNALCNYQGTTRLSEPTAVYNCHSYAWYRFSTGNPYWIMNISQFLCDSGCTQIAQAAAQAKDIIVYVDANGNPLHSGVVYSVSSSGELTICSKWGQAGVYLHTIENVPEDYCSSTWTKEVTYFFYRYHDYENRYTGEEYHSGVHHYFQYADVCKICNKQINTTWMSVACSGPPCPVIKAKQKIS